jgi:glycosyltransferase involved in cell wall biosynthesis
VVILIRLGFLEGFGFAVRVCLAYTGGLTPRRGGGVASVINHVVRYTADEVEYSLLTVCDEAELREIRGVYPSTVKIQYVKPVENVAASSLLYLAKEVDDFDILHFHDFPLGRDLPLLLKTYLRGKKLVYSHHISLEELIHDRLTLGYYYSALRGFAGVWEKVIANSVYILENDLSRFRSLRKKTFVIRNGIDAELIRQTKPLEMDGDPSILFVGHLDYRKGIDMMLEAFYKFVSRQVGAESKLHIVGSGALDKACREYVSHRKLDSKVRFWGSVPEELKFRLIKGSDIVVIPSRYENAPIVLLEAMAAGKPVIASRVGGIPEIVDHEVNGILIEPFTHQIAIAIESLSRNRSLIKEYGKNNEKKASLFTWRRIAKSYAELYKSILD